MLVECIGIEDRDEGNNKGNEQMKCSDCVEEMEDCVDDDENENEEADSPTYICFIVVEATT